MTPIDEVLAKIRERAASVNEKSDELNSSIEHREQQLSGVGVEFWWDRRIRDPKDDEERGFRFDDDDTFYVLGYCKVGDRWRIATKKRATNVLTGTRDVADVVALVKAPRRVRLEVAQHLEEFNNTLLAQIEKVHSQLDGALAAAKAPGAPKSDDKPKPKMPRSLGITGRGKLVP